MNITRAKYRETRVSGKMRTSRRRCFSGKIVLIFGATLDLRKLFPFRPRYRFFRIIRFDCHSWSYYRRLRAVAWCAERLTPLGDVLLDPSLFLIHAFAASLNTCKRRASYAEKKAARRAGRRAFLQTRNFLRTS